MEREVSRSKIHSCKRNRRPLFRVGMDISITAVIIDKRFTNPLKALIGRINSNLANGIVWFKVKPNYFISLVDFILTKSIKSRVYVHNPEIRGLAHDLFNTRKISDSVFCISTR